MFLILITSLLLPAQDDSLVGTWIEREPPADCISSADRQRVALELQNFQHTFGSPTLALTGQPELFTFYPQGGTLWGDLFPNNFVDLDPHPFRVLDWDCSSFTYNGHRGSDVGLRGFEEQSIGVPIFAALDGIVAATNDGAFDENTDCAGDPPANYVVIDHANGRRAFYWHMKNGSVAVTPGQTVVAGQQIGLTGSSGCSSDPHLHFEIEDQGVLTEPFAGLCRPGASEWVEQPVPVRTPYVGEFNITDEVNVLPPPFAVTRRGTFVLGGGVLVGARFTLHNVPPNSSWTVRYQRPNDTFVNAATTTRDIQNTVLLRRPSWYVGRDLSLFTTGQWKIHLTLNGQTLTVAPFDVVATPAEVVNRPPYPITASMHPRFRANEDDVLRCTVGTDLVLDDPDYDLVRYRYVWDVNGSVVRDVVSAGQSDVLPRYSAASGQTVTCTVTPSDGSLAGDPANTSVFVGRIPFHRRMGSTLLQMVSRDL
jgi:hypothetical protein